MTWENKRVLFEFFVAAFIAVAFGRWQHSSDAGWFAFAVAMATWSKWGVD